LAESVWASGCKSWYISDTGKIATLYPKNAAAFKRQLVRVKFDDFELTEAHRPDKAA
jgi:hypothetical protein